MTFEELLDQLSPIASGNIVLPQVIFWRVIAAFISGLIITAVTFITYTGEEYERSNIHAQLIITVVSSIIINVIGDNFARAIGLFGALSFIRFRTTLRDTKDTAIFFFSVAIGMSCGLGLFDIVVVGMVVILPLLFLLRYIPLFRIQHSLIKFKCSDMKAIEILEEFFSRHRVKAVSISISNKASSISYKLPINVDKAFLLAEQARSENEELIQSYSVEKD